MIGTLLGLLGSPLGRAGLGLLGAVALLFGAYTLGRGHGYDRGYDKGHAAGYIAGWNGAVAEQRRVNEAVTRAGLDARERRRACAEDNGGTWNVVTGSCDLGRRE